MMGPEELIRIMQQEGARNNPPTLQLAVMTGMRSCAIGDYPLEESDLLFFEHLLNPLATNVSVDESHTDKSVYISALKSGDTVAVLRIDGTKYLVLGKVVGA